LQSQFHFLFFLENSREKKTSIRKESIKPFQYFFLHKKNPHKEDNVIGTKGTK
jgi:hypothetical protein